MKTFFSYLGIIAGFFIVLAVIKNWDKMFSLNQEPILDANGNPIDGSPPSGEKCISYCLVPYPEGSQYAGYYYCNKNCGSFRTIIPTVITPLENTNLTQPVAQNIVSQIASGTPKKR